MTKYTTTKKKPAKKLVTINLDLSISEEEQALRDLLEQGERVAALMEDPLVQKKRELDVKIERVKQKIADLK